MMGAGEDGNGKRKIYETSGAVAQADWLGRIPRVNWHEHRGESRTKKRV